MTEEGYCVHCGGTKQQHAQPDYEDDIPYGTYSKTLNECRGSTGFTPGPAPTRGKSFDQLAEDELAH
jgi:hypothetical protein